MKAPFPRIPDFFSRWLKPGWSGHPKPAQVAAEQEWEDEGGSVKQPMKPQAAPAPKLPL
jgi:hypothetical protein